MGQVSSRSHSEQVKADGANDRYINSSGNDGACGRRRKNSNGESRKISRSVRPLGRFNGLCHFSAMPVGPLLLLLFASPQPRAHHHDSYSTLIRIILPASASPKPRRPPETVEGAPHNRPPSSNGQPCDSCPASAEPIAGARPGEAGVAVGMQPPMQNLAWRVSSQICLRGMWSPPSPCHSVVCVPLFMSTPLPLSSADSCRRQPRYSSS